MGGVTISYISVKRIMHRVTILALAVKPTALDWTPIPKKYHTHPPWLAHGQPVIWDGARQAQSPDQKRLRHFSYFRDYV